MRNMFLPKWCNFMGWRRHIRRIRLDALSAVSRQPIWSTVIVRRPLQAQSIGMRGKLRHLMQRNRQDGRGLAAVAA